MRVPSPAMRVRNPATRISRLGAGHPSSGARSAPWAASEPPPGLSSAGPRAPRGAPKVRVLCRFPPSTNRRPRRAGQLAVCHGHLLGAGAPLGAGADVGEPLGEHLAPAGRRLRRPRRGPRPRAGRGRDPRGVEGGLDGGAAGSARRVRHRTGRRRRGPGASHRGGRGRGAPARRGGGAASGRERPGAGRLPRGRPASFEVARRGAW
ncbi:unnamed protein product [Prorocentrum cordatum]|uniref:Uncharacterized protein n=1 Tax=Prorocentrum cordatum TaxID=2364126 RepID=A0ABN9V4F3_9DINO|nr:unnamed protein product [Polarella glacialis]